jgi:hypothetical protein
LVKILLRVIAASAVLLCSQPSLAQQTNLRQLEVNDTWRYRQTFETPSSAIETHDFRVSVIFKNKDGSLVAARSGPERANAVWSPIGPFPAATCVRDLIQGDSLGLNDNCSSALTPGKKWELRHADTAVIVMKNFQVAAVEAVEVPFGHFTAIRIEVDEAQTTVAYPGVEPPPGGYEKRFRTVYWFAPEVRGFVKIVREMRNPDGTPIHKMTEVLTNFKGM